MSATSSTSPTSGGPRDSPTQAQRTAEAKTAFLASLNSVGSNLDADLQARAKNIHAGKKTLDQQEKVLADGTKKLSKQNDAMQKFIDKVGKEIASFDGLGSGLDDLEDDLAMIEDTLRFAEGGSQSDSDHEEQAANETATKPDTHHS